MNGHVFGTVVRQMAETGTMDPTDEAEAGRTRRVDARRNLQAIVTAAAKMLAEDPRVSMQEIAVAAGLHRATVHRHFPSRDDLVRAVLERAHDEADRALEQILAEPSGSARDQLARSVDAMLEIGDRWRTYRFAGVTPEVQRRREAIGSPLRELVAAAQAEGSIRTDLSADLATLALGGAVSAVLSRISAGGLSRADAGAFVLQVVSVPS